MLPDEAGKDVGQVDSSLLFLAGIVVAAELGLVMKVDGNMPWTSGVHDSTGCRGPELWADWQAGRIIEGESCRRWSHGGRG